MFDNLAGLGVVTTSMENINFHFDSQKALAEAHAALSKASSNGCGLESDLTMDIRLNGGEIQQASFAGLGDEDLSVSFDTGVVLNSIMKAQHEVPVDPFGGLGDVLPESQEAGYFTKSVCKNRELKYKVGDEVMLKDPDGAIRARLTKVSDCGSKNPDLICISWQGIDARRSGTGFFHLYELSAA